MGVKSQTSDDCMVGVFGGNGRKKKEKGGGGSVSLITSRKCQCYGWISKR